MFLSFHLALTAGFGGDAGLHDEALDDAEQAAVVVKTVLHQFVETVGAVGRPVPRDLDQHVAFRGLKLDPVHVRSVLGRSRRTSRRIHRFDRTGLASSTPPRRSRPPPTTRQPRNSGISTARRSCA